MFTVGLIKTAWLFSKRTPEKEPVITKAHEKELLPHFKKHDALRKKGIETGTDNYDHPHYQGFINAVTHLEGKSGVPNEKLYAHMYKKYGYDRKK